MIFKRQISPNNLRLKKELLRRGENFYELEFSDSFGLLHPAEANKFFDTPDEVPEGITGQKDVDGADLDRAVSITELRCIDLIGEGDIEGLVISEYIGIGTEGNIGFDTVTEKVFAEIGIQGEAIGSGLKWLKSIRWNEVPLINGLNKLNYQQIDVKFHTGTNEGGISDGLNNPLTVNRPIGERLRGGGDTGDEFAKVYRIKNPKCKGVGVTIKVNQLMYTEKSNEDDYGDIRDTSVTYYIYYRSLWNIENQPEQNFILATSETVTGRASWPYLKQSNITFGNVPALSSEGHIGWEIKIIRETADSLDTGLRNQTFVDSFFEVYGDTFKYPNSACVQTRFSAEFFQSIPDREFDVRGLKVYVPADYNPITKKYGQVYNGEANPYWKGNFKSEKVWTDNPAWCFYDLLTNKRYGLGKYIETQFIDKWTLYEIARYCDTMVPDGYGGQEPRFTCNMQIQSRDEAYKVVNDMASIFRAVTYFSGGSIHASQDSEKDSITVFTNANVENGDFSYSSSARKARHTVSIVKYKDKRKNFENTVEYVEDVDGIRKFGIREIEMAGVGITSRGQAHRYGKWALLSEQSNVDTVNFSAGLEASTLRPGDIVGISDSNKYTKRYAGRTVRVKDGVGSHDVILPGVQVTLDSKIDVVNGGQYELTLVTPTYQYDTSITDQSTGESGETGGIDSRDFADIRRPHLQKLAFTSGHVTTDSEGRSVITVGGSVWPDRQNYEVNDHLVWMIEPTGDTAKLQGQAEKTIREFKVLNITEKEPHIYSIHALEYLRSKFAAVDGISDFDDDLTSPPTNPPAATILTQVAVSNNTKKINYQIIPPPDQSNILSWLVYIKFGSDWNEADFDSEYGVPSNPPPATGTPLDSYLVSSHPRDDLDGDYIPQQNGKYYFRVYSGNRIGAASESGTAGEDLEGNAYIEVSGVNPILDTMIHALTISGEDFDAGSPTDLAGTREEVYHDLPQPTFVWKVTINGESPAVVYDYKITVRAPSDSNVPSSTVHYTTTLQDLTPQQLAWMFGLELHLEEMNGVMLRDYDVTVEAIDVAGRSSAGTFTPGVGYSNPNGYDIVNVINPDIGHIPLTEFDDVESCEDSDAVWCSDQWLTPDGDVKILFGKGPNSLNAAMGALWICPEESPLENATPVQLLNESYLTTNNIQKVEFYNNSNNPMGVDISMVNYTEDTLAYITVAFGDSVDKILLEQSLDRDRPEINPVNTIVHHRSNVVKVVSRGDFVANYGTGFFRKYISGFWENGVGGGIQITHNYGINPIYSTQKSNYGAEDGGSSAYEGYGDARFQNTQAYGNSNSRYNDMLFKATPYGSFTQYYSGHRARVCIDTVKATSYLVTYVFTFDRSMPNNEYHVVFIPGLTTYGDNDDKSLFTEIIEVKVGGLSAGVIKPNELTDGQSNKGTRHRSSQGGAYGVYTRGRYGHDSWTSLTRDMKGRKAIIYKAPEGFAIKMQTSVYNTGNFTNRPIYIGIVSAV